MRHGARRCLPDVQQLPTVGPQRRDGAAIGPGRLDRSRPPWTGPGPPSPHPAARDRRLPSVLDRSWTGPGHFAQAGEQLSKMLL